ncbi:hypothetical protein BCR34DRAFT_267196 [Clohesyomyces aquaticus]|uniref:Uncharacterized protein n=1 Tax=Clohesyomyces aquaticus TaxID=1231657 RepID=A0A1Y1ZT08_9PLEO|nr:hypothetical protein BCR34DRAFT_267196 [Clohesyomyces aquaticus]
MDLAVGFAIIGVGLWKRWKPRTPISIDEPYLLNVPPEIRLVLYDFLFIHDDEETVSSFLTPLLTCRLIYEEALPLAFTRANFILPLRRFHDYHRPWEDGPFLSPPILKLPAPKLDLVRSLTFHWDLPSIEPRSLRRLFSELSLSPLRLKQLTFVITHPSCLSSFQSKYAFLMHRAYQFASYVMEELPLMENVDKTIFLSPGMDNKRNFQYLFFPDKPIFGTESYFLGQYRAILRPKKLGGWKYTVVQEEKRDVATWRLELTHPDPDEAPSAEEEKSESEA